MTYVPGDPGNGFHHFGPEISFPVEERPFGEQQTAGAQLLAFQPDEDPAPWPARIAVLINSKIIIELTPGEACQLAGALTRLSTQARASQP